MIFETTDIMRRTFLWIVALVLSAQMSWGESVTSEAQLPTFYSGLNNTSGASLVSALVNVCNVNTFHADSYATVWTNFGTTDVYPSDSTGKAGQLWDMYSNVVWTLGTNKCGSFSNVGDCYNREHSMPKSWFGVSGDNISAGPATDMHHMYPTDGKVNNQRSNYPFGECSAGEYLVDGDNRGAGKLGTSTLTGFPSVGIVWEPDNQYKGDFARTYMYMLMKWCALNNSTYSFTQDSQHYGEKTFNNTFTSDGNYGLTAYGVALLMKWHHQDPVSRKEVDRNNAVQSVQGNRNPFIDYPYLAEYLWGSKKDQTFSISDVIGSFEDGFIVGVSDGSKSSTGSGDEGFPGAAPEGYYDAIDGLQDSVLKSTLGALTYAHYTKRYSFGSGSNHTWDALWYTDRDTTNNMVIDMYSNVERYFNPNQPTASVKNCDIEHMFPNSWFGGEAGNKHAYCDLHHLVPADYSANRSKSNRGPGIPIPPYTFDNGVWINGDDADEVGVFCPPDEYKGDFARAFFYIASTYGDTAIWIKEAVPNHMTNDNWQEFLPKTRDLLLSWHRNDPVSDKERIRMNIVYQLQGNRNPFIDYPCLAEYIWGDKQGYTVNLSSMASAYDAGFGDEGCTATTAPTIIDPTGTQHIGITKADSSITKQIKVRGINLPSGNLTLTLSGANASLFSLSATSISSTDASKGQVVTITYTPTANGEHSATLTISGCGVTSHAINLTATCSNLYTATWKVEGAQVLQSKAFSGQIPTMPDQPDACDATRIFIGWTAQTNVTDRPADLFKDAAPALTADKTFFAVFADEDKHLDTKGHQGYKFSSNKWAASPANWVSGRNGTAYTNGRGIQVSLATSGAYATAPDTYTNVDTIKVNYCTNASSGAGKITIYVGEEAITKSVDKTGGATLREVVFDFATIRPSGEVVISVECTTNSIYIDSITISYCAPATYSNYRLRCVEVPQYDITFIDNGVENTVTEDEGATLSVTDPVPCEGTGYTYAFAGWGTAPIASSTTTKPNLYASNNLPSVTSDATYYAVYAYDVTTPGTPTPVYVKVTSTSGIENGQYLIVYENGSVALDGGLTDFDVPSNTVAITINKDTIVSTTTIDAASFTIAAKTGGYSIKSASNYYIGHSGSSNTIKKSTKDDYVNTLSIDENGNFLDTCNAYVIKYNTSTGQTRFRYYNSTTMKLVQLYKRVIANISGATTTYYTTSPDCPNPPTAIEEKDVKVFAQKVLIGGKLFIRRDGHLYDARGQRVK